MNSKNIVAAANNAAKDGTEIPCPECGMMFSPFVYDEERGKYTGVFCCIQCATAWYNAHPECKEEQHKERRKPDRIVKKKLKKRCKICGATFYVTSKAGSAMYCSTECKKIATKISRDKFRQKEKARSAAWGVSI